MFLTKETCTAAYDSIAHTFLFFSPCSVEGTASDREKEEMRIGMGMFVSQTTYRHLSLPFSSNGIQEREREMEAGREGGR